MFPMNNLRKIYFPWPFSVIEVSFDTVLPFLFHESFDRFPTQRVDVLASHRFDDSFKGPVKINCPTKITCDSQQPLESIYLIEDTYLLHLCIH